MKHQLGPANEPAPPHLVAAYWERAPIYQPLLNATPVAFLKKRDTLRLAESQAKTREHAGRGSVWPAPVNSCNSGNEHAMTIHASSCRIPMSHQAPGTTLFTEIGNVRKLSLAANFGSKGARGNSSF